MRTFWAVLLAAIAGFLLLGAISGAMHHDDGSVMWLGFLGGAALMGAIVAFRRPTDAELQAKAAKKEARRTREAARVGPPPWHKTFAFGIFIVMFVTFGWIIRHMG
jgi:hypothetical protein